MSLLRTFKRNLARNKAIAQKNLLKRQPMKLEALEPRLLLSAAPISDVKNHDTRDGVKYYINACPEKRVSITRA
jgi:hypothetical protein